MDYDLPTKLSGASGRATRRIVSAKRGHLDLQSPTDGKKSASPAKKEHGRTGIDKRMGRPRGQTEAAGQQAPSVVKRGPGRPRKVPVIVSSSSDSSSSDDQRRPGPAKRQRAKTDTRASSSASDDQARAPPIKRKVGRPRKRAYSDFVDVVPRPPVVVERVHGVPRARAMQPAHLPLAPRQGGSLSAYLQSWFTTGDFSSGSIGELEVLSLSALQEREKRDAWLYTAIDQARAQGLLQDRDEAMQRSMQSRAKEAGRTLTPWDTIIQAVVGESARKRAEIRSKTAICKRLARMVQLHWDEKLGRGEKQKRFEEKRMRAVAKWTVREVRKQWKLAVNVVKARRAIKDKEERDRVGREQLKAILEQSSQMLGRQHRALVQGEASSESDQSEGSEGSEESEESEETEDSEGSAMSATCDEVNDEDAISDGEESDVESIPAEQRSIDEGKGIEPLGQELQGDDAALDGDDEDNESIELLPMSNGRAALHPPLNGHVTPLPITDSHASDEQIAEGGRPRRIAQAGVATLVKEAKGEHDVEDDDIDFQIAEAGVEEDEELERKMWEEDESESDEDQGLQDDAELSIDELLKRYRGKASPEQNRPAIVELGSDGEEEHGGSEEEQTSDSEQNSDTEMRPSSIASHSRTRDSSVTANISVKIKPPFLLRGTLRPYQQVGFEWLANLYNNGSNGILADEMGLGKTIQTIALLAHLACDKGEWGPHLVVAPTSVMLNWEVEFKKFLPGFKILSYYGSQKERKEKRKGWNSDNYFNVCITSYQLILADQHILRRKAWQYLILDEAHHIKNFKSQRWQTLLGFHSRRRLLLTGTPLQNNLMDLWSLMYFLMPNGLTSADGVVSSGFASMREFQQWFSNPLGKAVENAGMQDDEGKVDEETRGMVSKLHTLLRPYLLRRLKMEVEKDLPAKYEHVIKCRLSKRQKFLYNDFMSRAKTRESLASGNYLSIINCLMQLRKVCNHPDLFEQRPIVTSFAAPRSVVADYEVKELLVRRNLLHEAEEDNVNLLASNLALNVVSRRTLTPVITASLVKINASDRLIHGPTPEPGPVDTWTVDGYKSSMERLQLAAIAQRDGHAAYLNRLRCQARSPDLFDVDTVQLIESLSHHRRLVPWSVAQADARSFQHRCDSLHRAVLSYDERREAMQGVIDRYAFVTPRAVANDMSKWALPGLDYDSLPSQMLTAGFDTLHQPAVKLQIAFPDASLLQYDCGKLQELALLMQRCKLGNHRILIFTQMTKILDILEIWLSFNGFNYLRLDGSTKVEDRQALTERFNRDDRIKAFILSTRSGGLGINLTGADMVLFWDLDWNFQIEAQCMDRAHRIGQTRDVHIYRFVSEHTIEENMLKKSNEKRMLDNMVIQNGQFTTEGLGKMSWIESMFDEGGKTIAGVQVGSSSASGLPNDRGLESAMDQVEDEEDAQAAKTARRELRLLDNDFEAEMSENQAPPPPPTVAPLEPEPPHEEEEPLEEGGTVDDYMLRRVDEEWDHFVHL